MQENKLGLAISSPEYQSLFEALIPGMIVSVDGNDKHPSGNIFATTLDGREIVVGFEQRFGGSTPLSEIRIHIENEPMVEVISFHLRLDICAYDGSKITGKNAEKILKNHLVLLAGATPNRDEAIRAIEQGNNLSNLPQKGILPQDIRKYKLALE